MKRFNMCDAYNGCLTEEKANEVIKILNGKTL